MKETNLCKNCKHYSKFEGRYSTRNNICEHEKSLMLYDNVTCFHRYNTCYYMRQTACGFNATLFEQKVSMLSKVIAFFKRG